METTPTNLTTSQGTQEFIVSVPELDVLKIQQEIKNGYVNAQWHQSGRLQILNYSQKTQFDWRWNRETMSCRGLIVDEDFNIVARPFPKFFSYEQLNGIVPNEPFTAFEKMDGSLGILYWIDDEPAIATRGSFESPQAKWATSHLRRNYDVSALNPLVTYLFEIIYPENRVVVDYEGMQDIVLLACVHTPTGNELNPSPSLPFQVAKRYDDITDFQTILDQQDANREGFVVQFQSGQRVKIKFDEYKRLHKLLTGVGPKHIWEMLRAGQPLDDLIERVPDEFHQWVKETENDLLAAHAAIEAQARGDMRFGKDRKKLAERFKRCKYTSVMFAILDGKDHSDIIWKLIKPTGQTVFKCESLSH